MSDGTESFACFLYPSNEISWPPIDQYPYAIAGFNYGNKIRFYTQPHSSSHDILDIEESSNIHFNGKWLYRINLYRIDPPPCKNVDIILQPSQKMCLLTVEIISFYR